MQRRLFFVVYLLFVLGISLSACGLFDEDDAEETAVTPVSTSSIPEATLFPQTPSGAVATPITVTEIIDNLIIWLPPEFTLRTETAVNTLSAQLLAFSSQYPNLTVTTEIKAVNGPGGMLSYLRTGRNVAADVLPDIVILPVEQLPLVASESLIYPLNSLLDPVLFDDLYPVADDFSRDDEQIVGYPFALTEANHLAYNSTLVTNTLPVVWDDLRGIPNASLVFPAAGKDGAMLALELYLAYGGKLIDEAGQPTLEIVPLVQTLTMLQVGRDENFISIESSNILSLDQSWQVYQTGRASMTQTSSDQYLAQGVLSANTNFAPLAGPDDALTPLIRGWAWAISTPNEAERDLAAELIASLITTENLGRWSQDARILPARQSALLWWGDDAYTQFSHNQMLRAQAVPVAANNALMTALGTAVFDVVSLNKLPQVAAEEAITALHTP